MPRFKSWDEIEPTATKAERALIERLRRAEDLVSNPGESKLPHITWSEVIDDKYDDRHIRATVLNHFVKLQV